jgi:hypothetical protein
MFRRSRTAPAASEISRKFGFPAPARFVELLHFIHAETGEIASGDDSYFQCITGMYLGAGDLRYQQTPPEFFPFARPGVDGIHFGYLIHDPRIGADFPVGYLCPMESDGVRLVGQDTVEAFKTFFSQRVRERIDKSVAKRIAESARILGISPSASRAVQDAGWGFGLPTDELPPVRTVVPKGWRHVVTEDGLGVLAPIDNFDPTQKDEQSAEDVEDWQERASSLLSEGYPASALVVLRNAVWADEASPAQARKLLCRAYKDLGRPLLATVAEQQGKVYK